MLNTEDRQLCLLQYTFCDYQDDGKCLKWGHNIDPKTGEPACHLRPDTIRPTEIERLRAATPDGVAIEEPQ